MAAHIAQPTRSRRFIKIYLFTWALLACGALAYLAVLAFPPQGATSASQPQASVEPAATGSSGSSSQATVMSEVRSMQGSLSEIRKDVSQLQEAVGERVINEKVVQTRLSALEERVSTIDSQAASGAAPGTTPATNADKTSLDTTSEPPFRPAQEPASAPATPAQIETGSIAKAEIVFGEPVVTRAGVPKLAVQLATGPSQHELRMSWGQRAQQHGDALATLKPRIVSPRAKNGTYRLIAGPVATEADAARICSQLGAAPATCFATPYGGTPL
jgi:hypothetical protein